MLPHLPYEPFRILQHQSVGNSQQAYADGSEVIFFGGIPPHLAWLRMHAAVKLEGQAMLEAIEIDYPVFDATLAAEFRS